MVYLLETGCHQQSPLPLSLSLSLYLPWSSPYLTFSFALFLPGCLSLFLSLGFSFVILILQFGFSSSDLELYFATRLSWHFRQSPRGRKDPRIVIVTDTCRAAIGPSSRTNRIVSDIKPPKISTYPCCQRACVESVFWVMPLTKLLADALGVVTISLVTISSLLGTLCIFYSFYFRSHIRTQGYNRLKYFSGPWAIRIIFIFFTIWWGLGEILRLEFIRQEGRLLNTLTLKWQDIVCKCYIVSNLGFSEPCLFLTLVFLLRASLQKTESGPLSQNFNFKTTIYILLFCFPILALQTITVVLGHRYETGSRGYFFKITSPPLNNVSRCYYPLTSTTLLGLFATLLNLYLFYLGRKILKLVISKGLRKRVLILIIAVSSFFPLRILLLGLSVLSKPGDTVFEVLAFLAFLSLLCCAEVAICMLVYYPIADSLKLKNLQDIEDRRRIIEEYNDTLSLIANQSPISGGADSGKQGSISFRMMEREENPGAFVELSLFSPSQRSSPVGSPRLSGWPMLPSSGG